MIRAIKLILTPGKEWEKIATADRGVVWVLATFLLPLVVIVAAAEMYGLTHWGERRGDFSQMVLTSQQLAIRYEAVSCGLFLVIIILGSCFLLSITRSFQVPATYRGCFTTLAYGASPLMLVKLLDAIPMLNTWICWAIGLCLTASLLYHGVALCMKPEQTKGFGLYVFSIIFVAIPSGLAHFISVMVLEGKLPR